MIHRHFDLAVVHGVELKRYDRFCDCSDETGTDPVVLVVTWTKSRRAVDVAPAPGCSDWWFAQNFPRVVLASASLSGDVNGVILKDKCLLLSAALRVRVRSVTKE